MSSPHLIFLAGPNGAGKSTFHEHFLAHYDWPSVNVDHLAKKLQLSDSRAASLADETREAFLRERTSFITETVFSDPLGAKLSFLRRAQYSGYIVSLIYFGLANANLSAARVLTRVR